jgi:hypothetical protein
MSTIEQVEDQIISTISALGIFEQVLSGVTETSEMGMRYPYCVVFVVDDTLLDDAMRPTYRTTYGIIFLHKSLKLAKDTIKSTIYTNMDSVKTALHKQVLGFTDIKPLTVLSRKILSVEDGNVISYIMRVQVDRRESAIV